MKRGVGKKSGVSATAQQTVSATDDDALDSKIAHLKDAYESSQGVIKFIDTKSNFLIGLSTVAGGFGTTLVKWAFELDSKKAASWDSVFTLDATLAVYALILVGLSFVAYLVLVIFCLCSVISRKAPRGNLTLLFPVARQEPLTWGQWISQCIPGNKPKPRVSHHDTIKKAVAALDKQEITTEYAEQLAVVGRIIELKLNHNRWASVAAVAQLIFLSAAIVLYFGIACGLLA